MTREIESIIERLSKDFVNIATLIDMVLKFDLDEVLDYKTVEGIREDLYYFVRK